MRLILRLLAGTVLVGVVLAAIGLADLVLNERRLTYAVLGRDGLIAACRPALIGKLGEAGFQPDDLAFDPAPDISLSSASGRTLTDHFTFQDGALRNRVDGILACHVQGEAVTVEMRTRSTPLRATEAPTKGAGIGLAAYGPSALPETRRCIGQKGSRSCRCSAS